MNSPKYPAPVDFGLQSFRDLLAETDEIIGESQAEFDIFREGLTAALMPMTAYEAVMAENLIMVEWEIFQLNRSMRPNLRLQIAAYVESEYVRNAKAAYTKQMEALKLKQFGRKPELERGLDDLSFIPPYDFDPSDAKSEARIVLAALESSDPDDRTDAKGWLRDINMTIEDIFAVQFAGSGALKNTSDRVADLEARRRRLKDDYDRLQRHRPIDAQSTAV